MAADKKREIRIIGWVCLIGALVLIVGTVLLVLMLGAGAGGVPSYLYFQTVTLVNNTQHPLQVAADQEAFDVRTPDGRSLGRFGPTHERTALIPANTTVRIAGGITDAYGMQPGQSVVFSLSISDAQKQEIPNANYNGISSFCLQLNEGDWIVTLTEIDAVVSIAVTQDTTQDVSRKTTEIIHVPIRKKTE